MLDPLFYFSPSTQFNHMYLACQRLKPVCFISVLGKKKKTFIDPTVGHVLKLNLDSVEMMTR